MADVVDLATNEQQLQQDRRIEQIRRSATVKRDPGYCLNCYEPLDVGSFCDCDCQHDFERRKRMKGYAGMG